MLSWMLPKLSKRTPLELLKRSGSDSKGYFTDGYVLVSTVLLAVWLELIARSSHLPFLGEWMWRWAAIIVLGWYVLGLAVFLLKWIFVDREAPADVRRAVLLFLFNLVQLRLVLCLVAVLVGGVPPEQRWLQFLGSIDSDALSWAILLPYQLLTWLVIGVAIGALAGLLRTRAGPAT